MSDSAYPCLLKSKKLRNRLEAIESQLKQNQTAAYHTRYQCWKVAKALTDWNQNEASPVMQQIGILNLRINDMMIQLNTVIKTMLEENTALKKENAELKAIHEKASNS